MINEALLPSYDLLRSQGIEQQQFHERAANVTREKFGRRIFVRAVVEVSNYCRENCLYCGMRRENRSLARYRAQHELLAELLVHDRPASVTDVNIQSGEDPIAAREVVIPLIKSLRRQTSLGISVCLGTLDAELYAELKLAGAAIYIIKFESGEAAHYQRMQAPGGFSERIDHIRLLASTGWKVSSGFIVGLPGQSERELLANFKLASQLPLDGCSVSPFIAGDETPLSEAKNGEIDLTLNSMAALRLMRPDWVIPVVSALNLAEPGLGYRRGLRTGANLATINMTPAEMRHDYLLYKRDRFIMTEERILSAIAAEGLIPSTQSLSDFYSQRGPEVNGTQNEPLAVSVS